MDPGAVDGLRTRVAAAVVAALDLPAAVAGDRPAPDKYRMQTDPALLRDVAALVAAQLPADTEVLAGTAVGGVPLAVAVSLHTGLPWALVRPADDARSGPAGIAGRDVAGRRAVVVKDMARSGAVLREVALRLRGAGAEVTHVAVGLVRNPDLAQVLAPAPGRGRGPDPRRIRPTTGAQRCGVTAPGSALQGQRCRVSRPGRQGSWS